MSVDVRETFADLEPQLAALRHRLSDPGAFVPRGSYHDGAPESLPNWQARAVLTWLEDRTGPPVWVRDELVGMVAGAGHCPEYDEQIGTDLCVDCSDAGEGASPWPCDVVKAVPGDQVQVQQIIRDEQRPRPVETIQTGDVL